MPPDELYAINGLQYLPFNTIYQLAAEQEELRQLLASQQEQLAILRGQREKLTLRSPIDGEVLTWDLEQTLSDRPVQRGQLLLSVGDLDGPPGRLLA